MGAFETTHQIRLGNHRVTKTYRSWSRGEPHREWRALELLHRHAPGLAARPLEARLDADPPTVGMTRLPGVPLGGASLDARQVSALAEALCTLHDALPRRVLDDLPARLWSPDEAITSVAEMLSDAEYDGTSSDVVRALAEARAWCQRVQLDPATPEHDRVLGLADGNLANCLWDGERVRLVDFEDSGVSDRCFELADLLEHPSAFVGSRLDDAAFLDALALDETRLARVAEFRRLMATFWLVLLLPGGPAHRRNPPGTLERHARRVRALFDDSEPPSL